MSYWTLKSIAVYVLEEIKMLLDGKKRLIGGGGGNRTRVRKSSAFGSTCVALSFDLTVSSPTGKIDHSDSLSFAPLFGTNEDASLSSMTVDSIPISELGQRGTGV